MKIMVHDTLPGLCIDVEGEVGPFRLVWAVEEYVVDINLWEGRRIRIRGLQVHLGRSSRMAFPDIESLI